MTNGNARHKGNAMRILDRLSDSVDVRLSLDEMTMLNNALNEICNIPTFIQDWEFQTRLGWDRERLRALLREINDGLRSVDVEAAIDKEAEQQWLRAIRDVLNRIWEPQYEGCAVQIALMLWKNVSDERILKYLERAETKRAELNQAFDIERGKRVVAAVRALPRPTSK
jgi:hypothetical protein